VLGVVEERFQGWEDRDKAVKTLQCPVLQTKGNGANSVTIGEFLHLLVFLLVGWLVYFVGNKHKQDPHFQRITLATLWKLKEKLVRAFV
jgi:hypothetical protein